MEGQTPEPGGNPDERTAPDQVDYRAYFDEDGNLDAPEADFDQLQEIARRAGVAGDWDAVEVVAARQMELYPREIHDRLLLTILDDFDEGEPDDLAGREGADPPVPAPRAPQSSDRPGQRRKT